MSERVRRYDLVTNYRCGSSIEEMERADDGEWMRYEDVEPLLTALRQAVNGWACYAKRKIEHDEITRLHGVIATYEPETPETPS